MDHCISQDRVRCRTAKRTRFWWALVRSVKAMHPANVLHKFY